MGPRSKQGHWGMYKSKEIVQQNTEEKIIKGEGDIKKETGDQEETERQRERNRQTGWQTEWAIVNEAETQTQTDGQLRKQERGSDKGDTE